MPWSALPQRQPKPLIRTWLMHVAHVAEVRRLILKQRAVRMMQHGMGGPWTSGLRIRSSGNSTDCGCFVPSKRSSAWFGGRRSITVPGAQLCRYNSQFVRVEMNHWHECNASKKERHLFLLRRPHASPLLDAADLHDLSHLGLRSTSPLQGKTSVLAS